MGIDDYTCIPSCLSKFTNPKSLANHQRKCRIYLHYEELLWQSATLRRKVPNEDLEQESIEHSSKRNRTEGWAAAGTEEIPLGEEMSNPSLNPPNGNEPLRRSLRSRPNTHSQARLLRSGFCLQNDVLPEPPYPIEADTVLNSTPSYPDTHQHQTSQPHMQPPPARKAYRTGKDTFGRYRIYPTAPTTVPDINAAMPVTLPALTSSSIVRPVKDIISPCPNISTFYIQSHHWLRGNIKSLNDREQLCNDVLSQPDFNPRDVIGFNFNRLDEQLQESAKTRNVLCPPSQGWQPTTLMLEIPPVRQTAAILKKQDPPKKHFVRVPGLHSQKLTDIIFQAFSKNNKSTFHYEPYTEYCEPPGSSPGTRLQVYGEIFSSASMLRAHREVQRLQITDTQCRRPRCIAYLMCGSDGLQFGSFSHVHGHPIYVFFGNESKYERCKPTSNTCFRVAHIPPLPDCIQEEIMEAHNGKAPTNALMTHLRRELIHSVWLHLLDDDFVDAWNNGLVIKCADGMERRIFPRIKTNSIDYPEKVSLATIRNMGTCLCPRCLAKKAKAGNIGTASDTRARRFRRIESKKRMGKVLEARRLIYELGHSVQSQAVEKLLFGESYVPTMNAFSQRLGQFKFNIFETFVVDLLHEIELGVWKSVLKHLIRVLHLSGNASVTEFNKRFRCVPTFGTAIRLFSDDVSSLSRLAARDFEDILQCCIPVFEGLLPEKCQKPSRVMLFVFAQWHGLAKLRLHTSDTLKILKKLTIRLGSELRGFAELTASMDVRETPKEYSRRQKQQEARASSNQQRKAKSKSKTQVQKAANEGRRHCILNLNTYKVHAMADYVTTIEEYGTTDSYSTQIPETQHRTVKAQYDRTNGKNAVKQMTRINDICTVLEDMEQELAERHQKLSGDLPNELDDVQSIFQGARYAIGQTNRSEDRISNISHWVYLQRHDDAMKFFLPQLKRHLLSRFLGTRNHTDYNEYELTEIRFLRDTMYRHKTLRINYTSYDIRRQQDLINPSTHARYIFLPSEIPDDNNNESTHQFLYAKVLGVYHADVSYRSSAPRRMDFIHIRWLYYDHDRPGGWDTFQLDRVGYESCDTDEDNLDSFDFVDPNDVIRLAHMIPDFCSGLSRNLLHVPHSVAHDHQENGTDWNYYYVNRFVDRDILMRYLGGGVGHYRHQAPAEEVSSNTDQSAEVECEGLVAEPEVGSGENNNVLSDSGSVDERHEEDTERNNDIENESVGSVDEGREEDTEGNNSIEDGSIGSEGSKDQDGGSENGTEWDSNDDRGSIVDEDISYDY